MGQSMRRFMKVETTLHVSYPQPGEGEGPILECLERICGDGYFETVEMARTKDRQVWEKAVEMIRVTHMVSVYGDQFRALSAELNINNLDETRRVMAVDALKEGIDGAYEMDCASFSLLYGQYGEGRKEQVLEQLLESTKQLYGYTREKGNMPICCKVSDYDIDKRALIGSTALAARYAGEIRRGYGNFGLPVDLSYIPMPHKTIEESILPVKDYITHVHMGSAIIKNPDCEVYGDNHPGFGFPDSENDMKELAHHLRAFMEIGFLGEGKQPIVSFEVKPWRDESPEVIIASVKHTLDLAWELV